MRFGKGQDTSRQPEVFPEQANRDFGTMQASSPLQIKKFQNQNLAIPPVMGVT